MNSPSQIGIPRQLIEKFVSKLFPVVKEMAAIFRDEGGEISSLPDKLKGLLDHYGVKEWAEAYDDFENFKLAIFGSMMTMDNVPPIFLPPPDLKTPEDVMAWAKERWVECDRFLDTDVEQYIPSFSLEGEPEPLSIEVDGPDGERLTRQTVFLTILLIHAYNFFSCMVHRKSLFQLVSMAKKGNDKAIAKAVQIDKTCLTDIPFFRERLEQLVKEGQVETLTAIAKAQQKPMFQSGTVLSDLYIVFALVDAMGLLEPFAKDKERFAYFCQSIRAYGPDAATEYVDVQRFEKVYFRFKKDFVSLHSSRPITTIVVKDTN